ncbi:uncharacterized protein BJ171DRAFT_279677 [Polychytrium aggregatum]|uniref:uncharacterized protein n=1 Tax=Polychytrium aggregatum TaxID=110093 RepID=UPI0022FEC138|nr:uncharacterized protein BJ171DRAFT_270006 [Polychytrium aggregatum]XP_052969767.1 uncharacterized protein BJ171DRAFT_279677 [Polychytrium aggregatum]KAI9193440.1 hypothetical protein BJ171DRAFT_270006 [Polychytrium aggregatum]KAI9207687.1 hypothetical protein BJ171DRAFT_279677 [Polychytrium aggregatum]
MEQLRRSALYLVLPVTCLVPPGNRLCRCRQPKESSWISAGSIGALGPAGMPSHSHLVDKCISELAHSMKLLQRSCDGRCRQILPLERCHGWIRRADRPSELDKQRSRQPAGQSAAEWTSVQSRGAAASTLVCRPERKPEPGPEQDCRSPASKASNSPGPQL